MHLQHKRMSCELQNVAFTDGVPEMVIFDKELLVENFHSKGMLIAPPLHAEHFAERALAKHLLDLEGLEGDAHRAVIQQFFFHFFHVIALDCLGLCPPQFI